MGEVTLAKKLYVYAVGAFFATVTLSILSIVTAIQYLRKGKDLFTPKKRTEAPKILTDPRWGNHHKAYLPQQQINLHYVEKGDKNKPLMLCLHGFPDCWFSYRDILMEFSKDFWVVAVDMRGYGDSDKPTGVKNYKIDLLVEDNRELVEVLGKKECTLVAHDWGGAIAWACVNEHPEVFTRHISLNGPLANAFQDHITTSFSQAKKSWYMLFFKLAYLPELLFTMNDFGVFKQMFQKDVKLGKKLTDEEIEVYKYYFSRGDSLTCALNYYRCNALDSFDVTCYKGDNLIIWGCQDAALDVDMVWYTFRYCDNLSVKFIPDSGHFVLQEFPDDVMKHMKNFLSIKN